MFKLKVAAVSVAFVMLIGCGNSKMTVAGTGGGTPNPSVSTGNDKPKNPAEDSAKAGPEEKPTPEKTVQPTPTPTATPVPTQQNIPVQPTPKPAVGEKLKFDVLDKLDNKKYSWWLTQNSEHKTPGFPPEAKKFVDKYDGIYVGDTSKKVVYLTFDEGYENGYTPKILDTLKENNVKSIFFITGPYLKGHPELVKRMLDEGHLVGSHTINHPSLPTVSNTSLENELYGLEKQFTAQFGKSFRYMRPPMGEYSERVMAAAQQLGYKTVFWSFAYKDYDVNDQKGADHAHKMVMTNLHNGAVYLLHAVSKDNAEALDRIIKDIKAEGYTISPFDL